MKKILFPILLLLVPVLVGYYAFFYNPSPEPVAETSPPGPFGAEDSIPFGDPPDAEAEEREKLLLEHARPEEFVAIDFAGRKNILGETVIEGTLKNGAELTTYKDLQMMIYFDDAAGNALDSASQVIFETLMPNKQVEFRLKEKGPRKSKAVRLRLHNAQIVDFE